MDVVSHGLWGAVAFGRKNRRVFWLAFLFGVWPDVFAFTFVFIQHLLLGDFIRGPIGAVPNYVYSLYSISHSLVVALGALLLSLVIWRGRAWVVAAWPLHILFDIVTHDLRFFPTPFLWPLPTPFISGIPWSTPWVFFMNWGTLILLYIVWLGGKRKN